jgi:hypothetical protein
MPGDFNLSRNFPAVLSQRGPAAVVSQGVVANKPASAIFTDKVLFFRRFLAIFFIFVTLTVGAMESNLYGHIKKYNFIF